MLGSGDGHPGGGEKVGSGKEVMSVVVGRADKGGIRDEC